MRSTLLPVLALSLSGCPTDGLNTDAGTARTVECRQVNAELQAAYSELVACDKLEDCGKMLPTLGSCGCTTGVVGRRDADLSKLERLFDRRSQLSDLPECEGLAGPCVCPAVGGVDCVDHACAWVEVDEGQACHALDGTFVSDKKLECGLGANGVVLCSWSMQFEYGTFTWQHSDVSETGSYACREGTIAAATGGGSYQGQVTSDGKLTFNGETYTHDPSR